MPLPCLCLSCVAHDIVIIYIVFLRRLPQASNPRHQSDRTLEKA